MSIRNASTTNADGLAVTTIGFDAVLSLNETCGAVLETGRFERSVRPAAPVASTASTEGTDSAENAEGAGSGPEPIGIESSRSRDEARSSSAPAIQDGPDSPLSSSYWHRYHTTTRGFRSIGIRGGLMTILDPSSGVPSPSRRQQANGTVPVALSEEFSPLIESVSPITSVTWSASVPSTVSTVPTMPITPIEAIGSRGFAR